jgi:hypothetical protein
MEDFSMEAMGRYETLMGRKDGFAGAPRTAQWKLVVAVRIHMVHMQD